MRMISLAAVAVNQTPLDWKGNQNRILAALEELSRKERNSFPEGLDLSRREDYDSLDREDSPSGDDPLESSAHQPDIIFFPELCLTGYGCEDAFLSSDVLHRAGEMALLIAESALEILPESVIVVGLPIRRNGNIYNCAAVLKDGMIQGIVPKTHLAGDGVHYEPRWFTAYSGRNEDSQGEIYDESPPFGRLLFDFHGIRFAIEICEDAWAPDRPALHYMNSGINLILNPSASHFSFGKYDTRRNIALESSRSLGIVYAMANLLGNESGRTIYDGSILFAGSGKMLKAGPRFSFQDSTILEYAFDPDTDWSHRSRRVSFRNNAGLTQNFHPDEIIFLAPDESFPLEDLLDLEEELADDDFPDPTFLPENMIGNIPGNISGKTGGNISGNIARNFPRGKNPGNDWNEPTHLAMAKQAEYRIDGPLASESMPDTISFGSSSPAQIPEHLFASQLPLAEREFLRAACLALFDYIRKTGSKGTVVSLSGGADSATCTLLLHRMIVHAVAELGPLEFSRRIGWFPDDDASIDDSSTDDSSTFSVDELESDLESIRRFARKTARRRIHTIYQEGENSSHITREAAAKLSAALGCKHYEVNISQTIRQYTEAAENMISRKITWEKDDLALQNIQARVRSPMAWYLANLNDAILISTGNRSETSMGYCTMDGDTSGGLAPIAGIAKEFISSFLDHMEKTGDDLGGAVAELAAINLQAPTAELRPAADKQTDEADLMPYSLLNRIERLAIAENKSPVAIYKILRAQKKSTYSRKQLRTHIKKFFQMYMRNQWKRERMPLSFHFDDYNLDPRSWNRFPILNGGALSELQELEEME